MEVADEQLVASDHGPQLGDQLADAGTGTVSDMIQDCRSVSTSGAASDRGGMRSSETPSSAGVAAARDRLCVREPRRQTQRVPRLIETTWTGLGAASAH